MSTDLSSFWKSRQRLFLFVAAAVFFVALIAPASTFVFYSTFPEHHYTDAAIPMLRSHDLLNPVQWDGKVRLVKPPLTYWIMIASYKLFGVSAFSSRLPFLLCGCATIWVTALLARELTGRDSAGQIAALALLSHPLIITGSIRSLPDIILTLCMVISGYGFIRLICLGDRRASSHWMAYLGAAMAIETKGLLAILFVAYALIFAWLTATPDRPFRRLIDLRAIFAAIAVGSAGFALMAAKHGIAFLNIFWGDQLGRKVDLSIWHYILRVLGFAGIGIGTTLPWFFVLALLFWKSQPVRGLSRDARLGCIFAGGWVVLLAITFSAGNLMSVRYLQPALPFGAVAIGAAFSRFADADVARVLKPLCIFVVIAFASVLLFGIALFWQTGALKVLTGAALFGFALLLFILVHWRNRIGPAAFVGFGSLFIWPLIFTLACPFKLPDETTSIARVLRTSTSPTTAITLVGPVGLGSRLRVATQGRSTIRQFKAPPPDLAAQAQDSVVVLSQVAAGLVPPGSVRIQRIATGLAEFDWPAFLLATFEGKAASYIAGRRESFYIASFEK